MPWALFDIETRIDKELIRDALGYSANDDAQSAYRLMREELASKQGVHDPFFPLTLHVPISIAVGAVMDDYSMRPVETIAGEDSAAMVHNFWARAERFPGAFVTYNGRAFDWPVLELAAFRYSVPIPNYFSTETRHRYRERHLDLHDFISNYGAVRNLRGGLSLLSVLLGMPNKGEIDGSQVQALYEAGRVDDIHRYCRNDVRRLYLIFLQVQLMRGALKPETYTQIVTDHPVALEEE